MSSSDAPNKRADDAPPRDEQDDESGSTVQEQVLDMATTQSADVGDNQAVDVTEPAIVVTPSDAIRLGSGSLPSSNQQATVLPEATVEGNLH